MIATDHQYAISKGRLKQFEDLLVQVSDQADRDPNPFASAHAAAVRGQVESLRSEMREYDFLRSGEVRELAAETLADLPLALIKARVARGLSQSALAELLGAKQQQVQRWETERFRNASLDTLARVARVLNVRVSERIDLSGAAPVPLVEIRRALGRLGFPREVIRQRLMPSRLSDSESTIQDEMDARLHHFLGYGAQAMIAARRTVLPGLPMRHKLPGGAEQARTRAYSTYVAGVCALAAKCASPATKRLPRTWQAMAASLFGDGQPDLAKAVHRLWDLGVPVVPLSDPVAFHGACWRVGGRMVIVLKQGVASYGRWLFDLLHETYHAADDAEGDFMVIEGAESSAERRDSLDEKRADRFAAEAITGGRTEQLTDEAVAVAGSDARRLKSAVLAVAARKRVPAGVLANLLAHRLAENGNAGWWPTATSMQPQGEDPWSVVRDIFLERADLSALSRFEAELLQQCLRAQDRDETE